MKLLHLAIVEDSPSILRSLVAAAGETDDLNVVFAVESAEAALGRDDWHKVDVAVVDLDLPGASGIDLIHQIRPLHPEVALMVFTSMAEQGSVFAALKAGACGYIVKSDGLPPIIEAIRRAAAGESSISPAIARWVIEDFRRNAQISRDADSILSDRETEVLTMLAEGKLYKEIADDLMISVHTAHAHIRKIYGKLQASGKRDALRRARLLGHLPPG
ncbi:MAG: response regulator transcription factor [Opitutales bacterium]|nr:response regulator transcription factor [Opitutales bacterium]